MNTIAKKYIAELQIRMDHYVIYSAYMALVIALYLFNKYKLSELFMLCGMIVFALIAARNVLISSLVITILLALNIKVFLRDFSFNENFNKIRNFFAKNKTIHFIFVYGIMIFSLLYLSSNLNENPIPNSLYPVEATKFILANLDLDKMRLFNELSYGSYLEFNGIKAFVDSRTEIFCEPFSPNCTILEELYNMALEDDGQKKFELFEDLKEKYSLTHAILGKNLQNEHLKNMLKKIELKYKVLFEDENFILFELEKKY